MCCCYQSQNYKIWKQFTTLCLFSVQLPTLLSITKLQNLKVIHNCFFFSKKEIFVVINHKTIKYESNSQLTKNVYFCLDSCYQSQNYKIWKQFTTIRTYHYKREKLLSITKLQNLKVIHNPKRQFIGNHTDVINHKTTKFERQFTTDWWDIVASLTLLSITKLQNLKAIHNAEQLPPLQ